MWSASNSIASLALASLLVSMPYSVAAQSTECQATTPLRASERAPCGGLLIPERHARRCLECVTVDLPYCAGEVDRARREGDAEATRLATLLAAYNAPPPVVRALVPAPWWRGWAWAGAGVLVGGAGVWLVAR